MCRAQRRVQRSRHGILLHGGLLLVTLLFEPDRQCSFDSCRRMSAYKIAYILDTVHVIIRIMYSVGHVSLYSQPGL